MRRPALVAFAVVSTLAAHADETALRGAPEVTAAIDGAPVGDQTMIERLQPAPAPAPLVPDAPVNSNPLWSIPLSALSETRDRPLFSVTRRSPLETVAAAPAVTPSVEDKAPEIEGPPFALMGTVLSSKARVAILLDPATSQVTQLQQGKINSGWTALSVGARSIVLRKGDSLKTLNLPGPIVPPPAAIPGGDSR